MCIQRLIDNLDRDLKRVIEDGNVSLDSVMNFDDIKEQIRSKVAEIPACTRASCRAYRSPLSKTCT